MHTFKVLVHGQPFYLANLIIDHTPSRTLHSSGKDLLIIPQFKMQFADRAFCVAAPRTWNDLSIHIWLATTASNFRKLKTHLFDIAYN